MSTTANNGDQPDALSVHDNAQNLLLALYNADDHRASTSDLKKPTGLTASNISGRHAKTLIREGWAERVGSEDVDAPDAANVYEITHRGKRQAKLLLRRKPVPMSEEERTLMVQQLQDRVEELEQQLENGGDTSTGEGSIEDLREQVEKNTTRLSQVEAALNDAGDTLDAVVEKVF